MNKDTLNVIFSFLSLSELVNTSLVCKSFNKISKIIIKNIIKKYKHRDFHNLCEEGNEVVMYLYNEKYSKLHPINKNICLFLSSLSGNKKLVKFFIYKGANDYEGGAKSSIIGKNLSILKLFVKNKKLKLDLNCLLFIASEYCNLDAINYLIIKGATNLNFAMFFSLASLKLNNKDKTKVVKYLFFKGAYKFDLGLKFSAFYGIKELVDFFIPKASKFDEAINYANKGKNYKLGEYIKEHCKV